MYKRIDFNYCFAGCLARNMIEAKRQIAAAVSVEKYARRWFCRCAYLHLRSAALVIQSDVRYMLAAQRLLHLKKDKATTIIQVSLIFESVEPNESKLKIEVHSPTHFPISYTHNLQMAVQSEQLHPIAKILKNYVDASLGVYLSCDCQCAFICR